MKSSIFLPATAMLLAATSTSFGVTILGSTADTSIQSGATITRATNGTDEVIRAGSNTTNNAGRAVVFVFELPTLTVGQTFVGSTLSFSLLENGTNRVAGSTFSGGTTPTYNLDLYGLGRRATSTVATTDIYFGATADGTDATLLQADFITSTTSVGVVTFSGASLGTYLTAQYGGGTGAGQFVFLRLNPDVAPNTTAVEQRYRVSMADNTGPTSYAKITPQIVPEPSSALLAGLGALSLLRRRRN